MSRLLGLGAQTVIVRAEKSDIWEVLTDIQQGWRDLLQVDYRDDWWPGCGSLYADVNVFESFWWAQPDSNSGSESRFGISGVTRDVYGSVLPGVTVRLFRTSTNELVHEIVSDATDGTFMAMTPYYPDTHYLVAYKVGSPDLAASTVNTLIGA